MRRGCGASVLNATAFILAGLFLSLASAAAFAVTASPSDPRLPQNGHWLPGPEAVRSMPMDILDPNPESVRLRFYEPPLEIGSAKLNGQAFQTIRMTGEGSTIELGAPELPKAARLIMVGNKGNVALKIVRSSYHLEKLTDDVLPAQPMEGDESGVRSEYAAPNAAIYSKDAWYPAEIAEISDPASLRDVRFVAVNVCPVQINPATREMRVYDDIEIVIANTGGTGPNEILHQPTSIDPSFKRLYRSFENFDRSSLDELPVIPGEYLVICRNYAITTAHAERLVNWHKRKGFRSSLAYSSAGYDSVRSIIQTRWTQSGGKLAYVCVLGDPGTGTADTFKIGTHGSQYDNYLATSITNPAGPNPDPIPDVAVGRISATNRYQLEAAIDKTILYETNPYTTDPTWFTQTWCASHTGHAPNNPSFKRYTQAIMLQNGIQNVFWNEYSNSNTLQADIDSRLNSGISVFNHRLSYIGEISTTHLSSVPTNFTWPFVMCITCNTGTFNSGTAVSEEWLMPTSQIAPYYKGAIGCVGLATSSTNTRFNNALDAGAMYGLYVRDIHEPGVLLIAGKLEMYRNYWDDDPTNTAEFCWYANLMGDPAVPIWTGRAWPLAAYFPNTINAGTNHVRVTVRNSVSGNLIPDALVCLWKGTESYSRGYTNSNGEIDLPCTTATTGSMLLTVTKENLAAKLDSIQIVSSTAWLAYDTVTVDDDNSGSTSGDNNHILSPGETVEISIRLRNAGTSQTVTGINGTLTCAHSGIQILSATSAYANISPGSRVTNTTPFRVQVSSVFNLEPITFYLNTTSSIAPETIRVDLTPRAPDVTHKYSYFSGGIIDPGEDGDLTVIIKNTGLFAMENAIGILRSLDPYIEVTDSVGEFGNVASSAVDSNNTDRFHISVSNSTFPGHRAVMQLLITDANGFRDSTIFDSTNFFVTDPGLINRDSANFVLTISSRDSSSPTGPDGHGYYAFDNLETHPAACSTSYQWVEIIPAFGGSGTSLGFSDTQENYDQSTTIALPFNFTFYGQSYSQITICSNGWLAFGTTLNHDAHNYRMGTPPGPPNQVAAYWDDLRTSGTNENAYYWYDAANFRFIVEWRSRLEFQSTHDLEKFQIILYDPNQYPSASGDGKIKIQYDTVAVKENYDNATNGYCSVGIQNSDHSMGVDYYYWNTYASGSSSIRNGRAIMFTTDATGQLTPKLTLSQPNGSENWFVGQSYNILWQSAAVQGGVTVELKRNYPSGSWETLFSNITNDGVQPWTVNAPAAAGTARMRIYSVNTPTIGDTSDAGFSITMPTVTLTSPNGGEILQTGSIGYFISWNSVGMSAVRVELNRDYPSANWEVIRDNVSRTFEWAVTGPPTNNARVRIIGIAVPTVGDTSNANFTIGLTPIISHEPHADQAIGSALFVAYVTDDVSGFTTKLFYRLVGSPAYDSLTFTATANPDEFSVSTPALSEGEYEYYLRVVDLQGFAAYAPDSGTYRFDVGPMTTAWITYDDSTAENYNWVDGPNFQWAVKFDPGTYPYALFGGRFAICPTQPSTIHQPILFRVILADGTDGMPGTVVFSDTTACASNVIGGLPAGAAWADVIIRNGGQPLQLSGPFYLSVQNPEIREHPVAFAHDTLGTRNHRSYFYDACEEQWMSEDATSDNARPGNRMIRANGFPLAPLQVVVYRSDSAGVASAMLKWTSNGAPYYRIYSATEVGGLYNTLEGYVSGLPAGQAVYFRDLNAIGEAMKRFYRVYASDQP